MWEIPAGYLDRSWPETRCPVVTTIYDHRLLVPQYRRCIAGDTSTKMMTPIIRQDMRLFPTGSGGKKVVKVAKNAKDGRLRAQSTSVIYDQHISSK